jgi:hypothetical protein
LEQRRFNARHHVRKILALAEIYSPDLVARAISDGLAFEAFSAEYIANILEARIAGQNLMTFLASNSIYSTNARSTETRLSERRNRQPPIDLTTRERGCVASFLSLFHRRVPMQAALSPLSPLSFVRPRPQAFFRPDHRSRRPPRAGAVKAGRHFVRKALSAFPGRALTAASTAAPSVGRGLGTAHQRREAQAAAPIIPNRWLLINFTPLATISLNITATQAQAAIGQALRTPLGRTRSLRHLGRRI